MNQRLVSNGMVIIGVLTLVFVLSGASCSQQSTVQHGSNQKVDERAMESTQQEDGMMKENQGNTQIIVNSSIENDVDSIISAEVGAANQNQADISSTDADDRASVTSDAEAFNGVGALGNEYSYE